MSEGPTIGLLGDVMLGRGVGAELRRRRPDDLWDAELRAGLASADLVIGNLECCISQRGAPTRRIAGKPFFFRAPPGGVEAVRAASIGVVGLANNHALDFGEDALADTVALLREGGVLSAGAGDAPPAARRAALASAGDHRVALVCVTDHPAEYAVAPGRWGVAHADLRAGVPEWLADEISDASDRADLVIAFLHWGPNMTTRPARWQVRVAAELQAAGADLVAGHSAHLFHGLGWTARGPIAYDLGDALDDYQVDSKLRNDLGVLALWRPLADGGALDLVGLRLAYARTGLARGEDAEWIAARLERACRSLGARCERIDERTTRVRSA